MSSYSETRPLPYPCSKSIPFGATLKADTSLLTVWRLINKERMLDCPVLPDNRHNTALFEGCHAVPACPFGKPPIIMRWEWKIGAQNDDRGRRQFEEKNPASAPISPTINLIRTDRDRKRTFAVKGRQLAALSMVRPSEVNFISCIHKDLHRTSQETQDASVRKHSHLTMYWKIMVVDYKNDIKKKVIR